MAAEAVTVTPHDPRKVAFRAIVAALQADATLAEFVAAWEVRDGDMQDDTAVAVGDHVIRLTPAFERMEPHACVGGGVRTWECPVTVQVESWVASANVDNIINLAGLIEDAVGSLTPAELRDLGISWLDLVTPAAQTTDYGASTGAFRFVVHITR
jgi:hypothetical protein